MSKIQVGDRVRYLGPGSEFGTVIAERDLGFVGKDFIIKWDLAPRCFDFKVELASCPCTELVDSDEWADEFEVAL